MDHVPYLFRTCTEYICNCDKWLLSYVSFFESWMLMFNFGISMVTMPNKWIYKNLLLSDKNF